MTALADWAAALRDWDIPEEIKARAPETPWGFPSEPFVHRAEAATDRATSPSDRRALEALPAGGSVLDVGAGAGAASLALAERAGLIVAVDPSEEMLREFLSFAERRGLEARAVVGSWPEAASEVEPADVVVCHHVLYNVPDLEPFVRALDDRARHRVVLEITAGHPLSWMNDLWMRFHDLPRPERPTSDDAERALQELGLRVLREDHQEAITSGGFRRREAQVAFIRKRLCLRPEQDGELAVALGPRLREVGGLWTALPERSRDTTLWWDTRS
jgi:SAM-dependent methyltransferase